MEKRGYGMDDLHTWIVTMTQDEKAFCRALGARIAAQRKEQGITQQQLADLLGISQQHVASYEVGRRKVAVTMLPTLAKVLGVALEELIGAETKPGKRGPAPKIQQQLERITQLPKAQQRFVMQMIETALAQQSR